MLEMLQKAIHILYAQDCSQSDRSQGDCIVFLNLRYVCTFLELVRLRLFALLPLVFVSEQRSVPLGQLMRAYF